MLKKEFGCDLRQISETVVLNRGVSEKRTVCRQIVKWILFDKWNAKLQGVPPNYPFFTKKGAAEANKRLVYYPNNSLFSSLGSNILLFGTQSYKSKSFHEIGPKSQFSLTTLPVDLGRRWDMRRTALSGAKQMKNKNQLVIVKVKSKLRASTLF